MLFYNLCTFRPIEDSFNNMLHILLFFQHMLEFMPPRQELGGAKRRKRVKLKKESAFA